MPLPQSAAPVKLLLLLLLLVIVCVGALILLAAARPPAARPGVLGGATGPSPSPPRSSSSPKGEPTLREVFGLWGDASRAAARAARAGDRAAAGGGAEAARLAEALGRLRARGLDFCPVTRRLAPFDPALDPGPVRPWLLYRPRAPDAGASSGPGAAPPPSRRGYRVAVVAPGPSPGAAALFAKAAPCRFEGAPSRVLLLRCGEGAARAAEGPGLRARAEAVPAGGLPAALGALASASADAAEGEKAPPDLVVVDFRRRAPPGGPVVLDAFVPTYPVELEPDVWVLTPIIAAQVAGEASGPAALRQALAARLGAVIRPVAGAEEGRGALRSGRAAPARRARAPAAGPPLVTPVAPGAVRFVPRCAHGWLAGGSAALLRAALQAARPETYVELGAWLGSSAVFAARTARALGLPLTIYAVDFFQNAAASTSDRTRLVPADKLYAAHPRFETFHANLADEVGGGVRAFSVRAEASAGARAVAPLAAGGRPAVVFVDCEKRREPLLELLRLVAGLFPGALVVGDDLVFPSVRQALADLKAALAGGRAPEGLGGRRVFETRNGYALVPPAFAAAFEAALAAPPPAGAPGQDADADADRGADADAFAAALASALAGPAGGAAGAAAAAAARARAAEAGKGDPGPWRMQLAQKAPQLLADPRVFEAALGGNPADWLRLADAGAQTPFDLLTHGSSFRL